MYLETERLIIRPPKIEDIDSAYRFRKDTIATKFVGGLTALSLKEYTLKYKNFCNSYTKNKPYVYSVILKSTSQYIGYAGIQFCNIMNEDELLYGFISDYWNKGYGYEAADAVLSYAFNNLNIKCLTAAVNQDNPGSEKILQKLGFRYKKKIEWPEQGLVNMYKLKKTDF